MTNKDFLVEVQKSCHLDMQLCLSLTDNLQKMLGKAAVDQIPVLVSGLGVFVSHKHPEYIQEDAQTGAMTLYPPRITYRMRTDEVEDSVSAVLLLSEYCKVSEDTAKAFLNALVAVVNQHLHNDEDVEVPGIGVFRNVITHQSDLNHLSYSPDAKLKDLVNTPFSCFEPFVISEGKDIVLQETATVVAVGETIEECIDDTIVESVEEPAAVAKEEETIEESSQETEENKVEENTDDVSEETQELPVIESVITNPTESVDITAKEQKHDSSVNYLFYVSLALILSASAFLLWLIFSDSSSDKTPQEPAVVVQSVDPLPLSEDSVAEESVLAEVVEVDTLVSDTTFKEKIVEEVKKPEETKKPEEIKKPEEAKKPEEPKKSETATPVKPAEVKPKEFHRLLGADGNPVTVSLEPGERLTLLALKHLGDKAFWPYIYDVNTDKLKAPNLVQAGMKLYLPDPDYYHIDANDPESLRKAKNRGAQLQK